MFPTTRVVELSWLARCVVRPARPTAFNRCVCSPFLASVSLSAYRVFGNCRIQPGKGVPGSPSRTSTRSLPSQSLPLSRATPFRFCFFFSLFGADLHLRIVSDRSLTQIDRDGESKRLWKDCYKNDWTSNISKSASVVGNYTRFLSREAALGLTCYFMLIDSLYLRTRPLDARRP